MKQRLAFQKVSLCIALLLLLGVSSTAHAKPIPPASQGVLDIGNVGSTGVYTQTGNTARIWSSGSDVWAKSDQFHYVWNDLPGDGQLVAQVQSQDPTDGWAKAGIMLRETLAGNAANVFLAVTPQHGITFQWRAATDAFTQYLAGPQVTAPIWLKLVRIRNTIKGFVSENGVTWTKVSSVTLPMGASSSIGLAVTAHNNKARGRVAFAHVALTLGAAPAAFTATRVYGQAGSFTTNTVNNGGMSADSFNYTQGLTTDSNGNLYVVDDGNNRVLYFPAGTTTATGVYGQPNFSSGTLNNGGISATSLYGPWTVATDSSDNLYATDYQNNRVLYFPAGTTTATRVYGQPNLTSGTVNNGGISATSLYGPEEMTFDTNDNLYLADYRNNRVLYFPAGTTTATRVYGQASNFTSGTANNGGISASSLNGPDGVTIDSSGNLYIADYNNNRVLYYPAGTTTATRVYGQPDFTSGTKNNGGISATSLYGPQTIRVDSSDNLYIVDDGNNRILYYPTGSTTATRVYGQAGNFTSGTANNGGVSASSLNDAEAITLDSDNNLYVADSSNNRVLMFPST